jgi:hypothetical protein
MPLRSKTARSARPSRRPNHGRVTAYPHDDRADGRTRSPLRLRAGRNSAPGGSTVPCSETGRIVSDGRSCPEMALQRLEKIESGPENGMVSEASKPLHLVFGRAADRALRRTKAPRSETARIVVDGRGAPKEAGGKFSCLQSIDKSRNAERISTAGGNSPSDRSPGSRPEVGCIAIDGCDAPKIAGGKLFLPAKH